MSEQRNRIERESEAPVQSHEDVADDATIVRPLPPESSSSSEFVDDETIVRPLPPELPSDPDFVDDATIVRPQPPLIDDALDDATIVRPRAELVDDATIVRPKHKASSVREGADEADDAEAFDDTATRAQQGRLGRRARREASTIPATSTSVSVALPVEDPEAERSWGSRSSSQGMDPDRRIAAVPGTAPWDPTPMPERGVRPEIPVIYGPRSEHMGGSQAGADMIHRELGSPPADRPVAVRPGRAALPSLEARARKSNVVTLAVGVGVLACSVAGLWIIATIAFS